MYKSVLIVSLVFLIPLLTLGQEGSVWYAYSLQGDKQRITETKDLILYEQVREAESPYPARIDTVAIGKRLNDSTYIVTRLRGREAFALMATSIRDGGQIKAIGVYYPADSMEAVETAYLDNGLPEWFALTMNWVFSEAGAHRLEGLPGYDEVTRDAVLEALAIREEISPALKAYAQAHPDTKPFRMYRFVEVKGQQKFIELGYNPYKPVPYNFEKQFEGDEAVIKALTQPVSFD